MIGIQIVFEEMPPDGSECLGCKEIIKGTMHVGMIQVGGPENAKPVEKLLFCTLCKLAWDNVT